MLYKTILFDLDGTLVDTLEDLTDSVNAVLEEEGLLATSIEKVRQGIGEGYRVLLKHILPIGSEEAVIDRLTALFQVEYRRRLTVKTRPYEGILPLLGRLGEQGVKIGVISNKMDDAAKLVCAHYFDDLIDAVVGDTPERMKKPAPDNLIEAMRLLGANRETTLYVGDSDVDVQAALNAELTFIGVSWGYRSKEILKKAGASVVVDHPAEIATQIK